VSRIQKYFWPPDLSNQCLDYSITNCPTGEMIFRYIDTMSRHVKPRVVGKPSASLSTLQAIWYDLISILTFRHGDLKDHYGPRDVLRINVHLDQLVKRGVLFKGRWFKKQWVGFLVVQRLAENWLEKNIAEGCLSWDRVLYKLLGIILQSALAARCGDIARSSLYQAMECVCYEDIELTLAPQLSQGQLSVQQLTGTFKMRYTKGKK
jgi:hypothetical protein